MGTKKNSLLDLAMSATKNNITTTSTRKSINDSLFEILFTGKEELSKAELIARISLERMEAKTDGELTAEIFNSEEGQKQFKAINKTVKNGFETAVCQGSTSASFCSNKRYVDYELSRLPNGNYTITKK